MADQTATTVPFLVVEAARNLYFRNQWKHDLWVSVVKMLRTHLTWALRSLNLNKVVRLQSVRHPLRIERRLSSPQSLGKSALTFLLVTKYAGEFWCRPPIGS